MQEKHLPVNPNLEQYKKIAKELVRAWRSDHPVNVHWEGSIVTIDRKHIIQKHPRLRGLSNSEAEQNLFTLADAQFMIAREYGFETWAEFSKFIESDEPDAETMEFRSAMGILMQGNFTALQEHLGGPLGFDTQIRRWHKNGYFSGHNSLLAEVLSCASMLGRTQTAEYLLDNGADPLGGNRTGLFAFHYAVSGGHLAVTRLMIERKLPLETVNMYGGTVLSQALWSAANEPKQDHPEIIKALIDAGANVQPWMPDWCREQQFPTDDIKNFILKELERKETSMERKPRRVVHTHHVLAVKNLTVSATYFKEKLGFELRFTAPGWEFLAFGDFKVMLGECTDALWAHETGDHSYFAHCLVENVDEVYEELKARGAEIILPIGNKPWGLREFSVKTPDGHRITFGQEI